ncbi:MAG: hypothetical protein JO157_01920 [Acetobacteraceae bacterium]|nr:hypothetical protein [Acetobacteraceae bacterium]
MAAAELEAEFDVLMARAGITIPPESRQPLLLAFEELRGHCALVRDAARTAAAEPANVYRLRRPEMG